MIKAPTLKYNDVFEALKRGDFYSSEGPLIYSLILDDKKLLIECSKCKNIILSTPVRRNRNIHGEDLTSTEIDVSFYFDNYEEIVRDSKIEPYFRVTIVDDKGRSAYTRAFFIKDLLEA